MNRWQPDRLLPGFEVLELEFPNDYDGAVVATLVRLSTANAPRKRVEGSAVGASDATSSVDERALFVPERRHGIHPRCTPRGHV